MSVCIYPILYLAVHVLYDSVRLLNILIFYFEYKLCNSNAIYTRTITYLANYICYLAQTLDTCSEVPTSLYLNLLLFIKKNSSCTNASQRQCFKMFLMYLYYTQLADRSGSHEVHIPFLFRINRDSCICYISFV